MQESWCHKKRTCKDKRSSSNDPSRNQLVVISENDNPKKFGAYPVVHEIGRVPDKVVPQANDNLVKPMKKTLKEMDFNEAFVLTKGIQKSVAQELPRTSVIGWPTPVSLVEWHVWPKTSHIEGSY